VNQAPQQSSRFAILSIAVASELQPIHPQWKGEVPRFDDEYERCVALTYDLREEKPLVEWVGHRGDPRRCAVCERHEPDVSFATDAHLVPACLGNRSLFALEECDSCNQEKGQTDEDDLGKMLLPHRVLGRVRARNGTAKLKPDGGNSFIGGGAFDGPLPIVRHSDEDTIRLDHSGERTSQLSMWTPSHRPGRAIRSLLRSVWLAMDGVTKGRHGWLREVVAGKLDIKSPEYFEFFLGGMFDTVLLEAWQRRASSQCVTAPLVVRLAFVQMAIVWCAPEPQTLLHGPSLLPPVGATRPSSVRYIRLPDPEARQDARTVMFTMNYQERTAGDELEAPSVPAKTKAKKEQKHRVVSVEFSGTSGAVRVERAFLVKDGLRARRPYFEVRGGGFAGWLSANTRAPITLRADFQPYASEAMDALRTLELFEALRGAGRLRLIDRSRGHELMNIDKGEDVSGSNLPDRRVLADLVAINQELGLDLRVPEPPALFPVRDVALVAAAIAHGPVGERVSESMKMNAPVAMARVTIELVTSGSDLVSDNELPLEILGHVIDAGRRRIVVVKPRLVGDPTLLDAELSRKDNEDIVDLELQCDMIVHEFERWPAKPQ
jgi:hypothetical protein